MLTIYANAPSGRRFCDGISRRNFLKIGALGLGGLALSIRRSFARQIRELEGRFERGSSNNPTSNALPPPLPSSLDILI